MLYCPKCLNNSLHYNPKGVINIIINGKQMDAGRFIYNLDPTELDKMIFDFKKKSEEFFKWYSNFQNKEAIARVELLTLDVKCDNKCVIPTNLKFSAVDTLIPSSVIKSTFQELGEKFKLEIELKI